MTKTMIPWKVFWNSFKAQTDSSLRPWLDRLKFTDQGVVLIEAISLAENPLQSLLAKQDLCPQPLSTDVSPASCFHEL